MPQKTRDKAASKTGKTTDAAKRARPPKAAEIGERPTSEVAELPEDGGSRSDVPDVGERPADPGSGHSRGAENDGTDIERAEPDDVVGGGDIERGPGT